MTITDPTAPGEALRWAVKRLMARSDAGEMHIAAAWLAVWADELDAARATDPDPAAPPELYAVLSDSDPDLTTTDRAEAQEMADQLTSDRYRYRAYRLVPLSSTPPAGTAPASATAVDPPAGTVGP